jgi:hypothetical protein
MISHPSTARGSATIPEPAPHVRGTTARKRVKQTFFTLGGTVVALLGLGWAGLQVRPAPFAPVPQPATAPTTMPLPAGLPAPVERYYRLVYGEQVPVITSGAISGRGTMAPFGVALPARFRFMHDAGRNFRAYFELTLFGRPVMKANEHYVDGAFRQEISMVGVTENQPRENHGAALRMWSEWVIWLPAMLLTDPDVRWEAVDDTMALLVVPVDGAWERLVVRFDPATGQVQYVEAMKYKRPSDTTKTLWSNAVWFGDRPWANFDIEQIVVNAPIDTSRKATGP